MTTLLAATSTAPTFFSSGTGLAFILLIIGFALLFDFLNGFHDAANSIATVVATRVLTPTQAVIWAAAFNFIAAFIFGTSVAGTISGDMVDNHLIDVYVVFGGLLGAIIWNIITWLLGLPTSSSHALVGGLGGAAVLKSGIAALKPEGWTLVLIGIVLAPVVGFILGTMLMVAVAWIARKQTPHRMDRLFRKLQLLSAALYSLGHGGNDAQKTMGIIVMLLTTAGLGHWTHADPHSFMNRFHLFGATHNLAWWIILTCHAAIALGTCFGGWRIVKTMGHSITRLQPVGGFCAETAAATAIFAFTKIRGVPISTTHAITGAILGVGTTKGVRSVRWIWGQRIVMAWILTIPCAAFMAAITYGLIHLLLEPYLK
ncbi:MAG TPA: inorganic phosphate transporter [Tepidisphaeraceae bacterium]|jgi:PiT family inorganic phosphate transporter|nr:inorganic phosphate transporter [Tepidisphaeraceae bacterium]